MSYGTIEPQDLYVQEDVGLFHNENIPPPEEQIDKDKQLESIGLLQGTPKHPETGTITSAMVSIANAAVGAGILALPFAIKNCGLVLGIILLLYIAASSYYSTQMLVAVINETKIYNYEEAAGYAFGKYAMWLIKIVSAFVTFGAMVGFSTVVGDNMPGIVELIIGDKLDPIFYSKAFVSFLVLIVIKFPLLCLKNISSLKYSAFIAVSSVVYVIVLVVVQRIVNPSPVLKNPDNPLVLWDISFNIFKAIPLMVYAHNCHIVLFPILSELKNKTRKRMAGATFGGVTIYVTAYIIISIIGYLSFYGLTDRNILQNYDMRDIPVIIGKVGISLTCTLGYPLQGFTLRKLVTTIFWKDAPFSWVRHILLGALFAFSSYIIATLVGKIDIVFGIVGAAGIVLTQIILPSLLYIKVIIFKEAPYFTPQKILRSIIPGIQAIIGIFLAITCTTVVIIGAINSE